MEQLTMSSDLIDSSLLNAPNPLNMGNPNSFVGGSNNHINHIYNTETTAFTNSNSLNYNNFINNTTTTTTTPPPASAAQNQCNVAYAPYYTPPMATMAARKQMSPSTNDPNEPAKPLSPYTLFFRDTVSAIKQQNPNCAFADLQRIVSSMWDVLDPVQKEIYNKKAETARNEYLKQLRVYKQQQPPPTPTLTPTSTSTVNHAQSQIDGSSNNYDLSTNNFYASSTSTPISISLQDQMTITKQEYQMQTHNSINNGQIIENEMTAATATAMPTTMLTTTTNMMTPPVTVDVTPPQPQPIVSNDRFIGDGPISSTIVNNVQESAAAAAAAAAAATPTSTPTAVTTTALAAGAAIASQQTVGQPTAGRETAGNELCIRDGCAKRAIMNPDWEDEYCSNECVVIHCRNVFNDWVQQNKENPSI